MRALIVLLFALSTGCALVPTEVKEIFGEDCVGDIKDAAKTCADEGRENIEKKLEELLPLPFTTVVVY